jgi:sugar phosphate isomerase/epimerase
MEPTFINDEVSRDLAEAVEFAVAERLSAIELRMIGDTNVVDLDWPELESIATQLSQAKLRVAAISTPLFKCPLEEELAEAADEDPFKASSRNWREHLALIPKAAAVATLLETTKLRCFGFLGDGQLAPVREEVVRRLGQAGRRLAAIDPHLRFCLENEHSTYVRTAAEVGSIVREVGRPFEVLWDPGNAYYSGIRAPVLDFHEVSGLVSHIHVKDPRSNGAGLRFVPLGEGEIDYPGQVDAWAKDDYSGYVSLEPHLIVGRSSLDGVRRCLRYLRPLLEGAGD